MDDCLKARAEDIPVTFKDYTRSELRISYHSWYNPNVSPHVFQFLTVEVIVFIQLNVINAMLSRFSRVRLCATDPLDSSPPGSSVHGIFQARVMEWGAIDFSKLILYYYAYNTEKAMAPTPVLFLENPMDRGAW